jgi:hypothetical protein
MTELAALNVKINGDSADLQSDIAKAKAQLQAFDTQVNKAQAGTTRFSGGLSRLGNVSGSTRAKIQNTSFQLQDIAVQLQGGTRASTVFAQQLPQLLSGFGALGAVAGVLAGVGIPALAFAFQSAGNEVIDADEAIENFIGSLNGVTEAFNVAKTPLSDLREEFGKFAEQVRQAALLNAQASLSLGLEGLAGAVSVIQGPLDDVTSKLRDYSQAVQELNTVQQSLGERTISNAAAFDEAEAKVEAARAAAVEAAKAMGMSANEAVQLDAALRGLAEAQGMEEVAEQSAKALELLRAMFPPTEKIPPEIAKIVAQLEAVLRAASAGVTALNSMGDAAANAAAKTAAASREFAAAAARRGVETGAIPPEALADLPMTPGQEALEKVFSGRRAERDRAARTSGAKGRKTNPLIAQLENVQNALMTQEEMQIASFERQQETLNAALEQRLLTQQEYNDLMEQAQSQHADRMTQIDVYRYGTTLQRTGKFMGDMANVLQNGNEKMLKIAKVFSAAEALINVMEGASKEIAKGGLAGVARAAMVVAAGMQFVNAIKGVSASGSTSAPPGIAAGVAAAAPAAPAVSRNVAISLTGGDMFSRDQVINLINSINEAVEDGAIVRLV